MKGKGISKVEDHRFNGLVKLAVFFGLLLFAGFLQLTHSQLVGQVVTAVLVIAAGGKIVTWTK